MKSLVCNRDQTADDSSYAVERFNEDNHSEISVALVVIAWFDAPSSPYRVLFFICMAVRISICELLTSLSAHQGA